MRDDAPHRSGVRPRNWPDAVGLLTNALIGTAVTLMVLVVILHLGLLAAGHWQGDEYYQFAMLRNHGWRFVLARVIGFSPRPISEALLFLYGRAVETSRDALIAPFLLLLWSLLIASSVTTLRRQGRLVRLLLGCSLLTMFLLGHSVGEMFYWPMAAAAYLPTLAAQTFIFFRLLDGRSPSTKDRLLLAAALIVAAGSSEVGAAFVVLFAGFGLVALLIAPLHARRSATDALFLAPALVLALALLGLHAYFRPLLPQLADTTTLGHPLVSLLAGVPQLARDIISLAEDSTGTSNLLIGVTVKVLLFVGFRWCCSQLFDGGRSRLLLVAFALSLVGASLISILAADYEYGMLCCERHGTLRECMMLLALASVAALPTGIGRFGHDAIFRQFTGPLALLLAIGIALAPRLSALAHDYGEYHRLVRARSETWLSGQAATDKMVFHLMPRGQVVGSENLPLRASASMDEHPPWYVAGILFFFRKDALQSVSAE